MFDGINDYVEIPGTTEKLAFVQNTGVFTISAFIKLSDLNARSVIVASGLSSSRNGFAFVYDNLDSKYGIHALRFTSTNGDPDAFNIGTGLDYAINDTEWHHVAVVGDGSMFRFYLDGAPDGYPTSISVFASGPASANVRIGSSQSTTGALSLPMHGAIDEVHIFDKALSESEIRLLAAGVPTDDIDEILKPVDRSYRFAYQGQYAELDKETGWSHFESREYDPAIGRWLVPDPAGQYWSPYLAMGNNPVVSVDPNGEIVGTIIGGLVGAGIAMWNGENVGRGLVSGLVAGATFDLIVGSAVATGGASLGFIVGAGAVSGAAGAMTEQVWDAVDGMGGSAFSAQKTLDGAVMGAAMPLVGQMAGKVLGTIANKLWWAIKLPKTITGADPAVSVPLNASAEEAVQATFRAPTTGLELATRASIWAESAVGGTGRFKGSEKHAFANMFVARYQRLYGNRGLQSNFYFNGKQAGSGYLDLVNHSSMAIYDYKFGTAVMSKAQFAKYSRNFPGYSITVIKP